jgi:hypothetical protein
MCAGILTGKVQDQISIKQRKQLFLNNFTKNFSTISQRKKRKQRNAAMCATAN